MHFEGVLFLGTALGIPKKNRSIASSKYLCTEDYDKGFNKLPTVQELSSDVELVDRRMTGSDSVSATRLYAAHINKIVISKRF